MNWKLPFYDVNAGIDIGWIETWHVMDWLSELERTPQDPIWHAEGNVKTHTLSVVENLMALPEFMVLPEQDKHIMVTAALFHDIEKRSTTREEWNERESRMCIAAPRHAQKGEKTTREILYKEFDVPFKIREEICALVRYHGVPLWSSNELDTFDDIIKLLNISTRCRLDLLKMISKADVLGRICNDKDELLEKLEYFQMSCEDYNIFKQTKEFNQPLFRYKSLNSDYIYMEDEYPVFDDSKFKVHMLSGLPGSGKDHYIKNNLVDYPMVSLDNLRRERKIKHSDKKGNGQVIQRAQELCKMYMRNRLDFIFNATNITTDMRKKWIKLFESYGGNVIIHYLEVPYKELITQNRNRSYPVPEKVIDNLIWKLEIPTYKECYDIKFNT